MSSKKRRIKRKIDQMIRMDRQYHRLAWTYSQEKQQLFVANMKALGRRISGMGYRDRGRKAMRDARIREGRGQ